MELADFENKRNSYEVTHILYLKSDLVCLEPYFIVKLTILKYNVQYMMTDTVALIMIEFKKNILRSLFINVIRYQNCLQLNVSRNTCLQCIPIYLV